MPVKRRTPKRRADAAAEIKAWATYFDTGFDYFGALPEIGVGTDANGVPERAVAEEAWHRLGAGYLADPEPKLRLRPLALAEFGEPHAH